MLYTTVVGAIQLPGAQLRSLRAKDARRGSADRELRDQASLPVVCKLHCPQEKPHQLPCPF